MNENENDQSNNPTNNSIIEPIDESEGSTDIPLNTPINTSNNSFPKVIAFLCNWCSYEAADNAGTKRLTYSPEVIPIRVMCTGMIDPQYILHSLKQGVDGVFIGGCHFGDCHYKNGNYKAFRRAELIRNLITQLGFEPKRVRFENISAAEADKFADVVTEFVNEIKNIGPNTAGPKVGADIND